MAHTRNTLVILLRVILLLPFEQFLPSAEALCKGTDWTPTPDKNMVYIHCQVWSAQHTLPDGYQSTLQNLAWMQASLLGRPWVGCRFQDHKANAAKCAICLATLVHHKLVMLFNAYYRPLADICILFSHHVAWALDSSPTMNESHWVFLCSAGAVSGMIYKQKILDVHQISGS